MFIHMYIDIYMYTFICILVEWKGGGGGRVVGREREESDLSRTAIQIHELR